MILWSRKRANSLRLLAPHPSTMLSTTDSAARVVCDCKGPYPARGNPRVARRTSTARACDRAQMSRRRWSRILPKERKSRRMPSSDCRGRNHRISLYLESFRLLSGISFLGFPVNSPRGLRAGYAQAPRDPSLSNRDGTSSPRFPPADGSASTAGPCGRHALPEALF